MNKQNLDELVDKNQFIKLVPSLEDSLQQFGLDVHLDENSKLWLYQLFETWNTWKKSLTVVNHIELFFNSIPDPYRVALVFVIKCHEFKDCKPKSLPFCIIETLQKWSKTTHSVPEEGLKLPAFHIATKQRNQSFLNLVVKTYNIFTMKEAILPMVKDHINNDNCKQAIQIVTAMQLFDDIPIKDILFPLVLQDKLNMIDEYLSQCPTQVQSFLFFLDTLLDKKFNVREYAQQYIEENKISNIKYEKIHYKPLGKLTARLCNKFKIPIETCKNLSKNRTTSGLRYLIHQKYSEHNLSSSVWDDLVKDSLRQNSDSAEEFVETLADYDKKEALKWAQYLNLPKDGLPLMLKEFMESSTQSQTPQIVEEEENWDSEKDEKPQEYFKLSLSDDQIIMIDSVKKFSDLISTIAKCSIASVDCEWKPSFLNGQSNVAILQVATRNCVYLIDTLLLNVEEYTSLWHLFYKKFLDNPEIIKLGFGLEQDLKEIKASIIGLNNIKVKGEGLLDLHLLWNALIRNGMIVSNNGFGGSSLNTLVQICFGLPLAKLEQCSNWELRPLRESQIQYAALDAYVLLNLYDFIQKLCAEQGINFEEISNDVMLDRKNKSSKKPTVAEQLLVNSTQRNPSDLKFLVEPALSHLMSYLRYCGIDTTVMTTSMLWDEVINLAISEDRYIILSKLKYTPTVNYPQSSILSVGKGTVKEQLHTILRCYNINVKPNNVFSRCLRCNDNQLKQLPPNEVSNICKEYQSSSVRNAPNLNYDCNYNDDDDNYNDFLDEDYCDELCPPIGAVINKPVVKTSKGSEIEISNVENLSLSNKPATLCELCGKMYWDEDIEFKTAESLISSLIKLKIK